MARKMSSSVSKVVSTITRASGNSFTSFIKDPKPLAEYLDRAYRFYSLAGQRDAVLVDNALSFSGLRTPNSVLVLITGGFHTEGIERILAESPNDAIAHFSLGNLYARDRATYAKARDHYQQFLKLSPNSTLSRGVRHWLEQNP